MNNYITHRKASAMKNKYIINIAGAELIIMSEEEEDYVKGLTKILDRRINDMVVNSKKCTRFEAAVLCALDYLDGKVKDSAKIEELSAENAALKKKLDEKN